MEYSITTGSSKGKTRYQYIDVLNILACLCVVFMHCNGIVHSYENTRAWKESMIVETVAYWAVPVFFMISGATLLGYRDKYSTTVFLKKRMVKTVIPFVIWTVINIVFKTVTGLMEPDFSVSGIISMFNNTTAESVYWFFIPLFMVYLSMPVVSLLKDNRRVLVYIAGTAFLIYSVYPMFCRLTGVSQNSAVILPVAGGYMLFVVLGYLFSTGKYGRGTRIFAYVLGIFGIAVRYGSTLFLSERRGELAQDFWGYLNFPSVFLAAAVFLAVRYIPWEKVFKTAKSQRIVSQIAGAGFGVYLMHMIVYRILEHLTGLGAHSYLWRFGMPFVIYFICVAAVLIVKKIPVLKHIVP